MCTNNEQYKRTSKGRETWSGEEERRPQTLCDKRYIVWTFFPRKFTLLLTDLFAKDQNILLLIAHSPLPCVKWRSRQNTHVLVIALSRLPHTSVLPSCCVNYCQYPVVFKLSVSHKIIIYLTIISHSCSSCWLFWLTSCACFYTYL